MDEEIEKLLSSTKGFFDTEQPKTGHRKRFVDLLETAKADTHTHQKFTLWFKPLSAAAAIIILVAVGIEVFISSPRSINEQVAYISPEVANSEYYFNGLIEEQIVALQSESAPETQPLIIDTMNQLEKLKSNYVRLERDLLNGGNSKLILSAMITNFQTRIALLQEVLEKVATIKKIKQEEDANYTI